MPVIRECIRKMTAYIPGEPSRDRSEVKLNQNENRYPMSPRVMDAVSRAAADLPLYPDSTSRELRQAAARVFGTPVERIMASNGSDEMLNILFQACCDPGDEVVAFFPSYSYYATLAAIHDVNYRLIDLEGEFSLPARLDVARAKLVILPNPNAPTGTLFPEAEVRRLVEAVTGGLAVIDEAYADYAGFSVLPLLDDYENLVVVRTFSKSYSLAGLRAGFGFANAAIMAELEKVRDFYNLDRLAQAAAEAALLDQDWLKQVTGRTVATRERIIPAVRRLGLTVYDSAANFFLVRCSSPERARAVFQGLRDRKVLIRYFNTPGIDDCVRVSVGTDEDMDIFLRELEAVLSELPPSKA